MPKEALSVAAILQALGEAIANIDHAKTLAARHESVGTPLLKRVDVAKTLLAANTERASIVGDLRFGDPAWNMMLDLYVAREEQREVSVSSLSIAAGVPQTTALRWIMSLVGAGVFSRSPDSRDGRRTLVFLEDKAATSIELWLDRISERLGSLVLTGLSRV